MMRVASLLVVLGAAFGHSQAEFQTSSQISTPSSTHSSSISPRTAYLALQVPVSTGLYGIALPWALDAGGVKTRIATPLIVAPFAFGAHLWIARTYPFTASHQAGTSYLSLASMYAGFALPASLIDNSDTRWRAAAWTTMALYPAGVFGGYWLGEVYDAERIKTQSQYALGFGMLGFFTPLLYFDDFSGHQEAMLRIGLAQSVGLAGMGHFISRYRQTGPDAASGVNLGLMNHTLLGTAAGLTVAAWADAKSVRPWLGGAVLGGTLGFMEGLWFFSQNRDSHERSLYSGLGIAAGAVAGAGFTLLLWDENGSGYSQRVMTASFLAGGALLGYAATYALTQGMHDMALNSPLSGAMGRLAKRRADHKAQYGVEASSSAWSWKVAPVPLVVPILAESGPNYPEAGGSGHGDGRLTWRYSIPGFIAQF
jgi:hypothetical protein